MLDNSNIKKAYQMLLVIATLLNKLITLSKQDSNLNNINGG